MQTYATCRIVDHTKNGSKREYYKYVNGVSRLFESLSDYMNQQGGKNSLDLHNIAYKKHKTK